MSCVDENGHLNITNFRLQKRSSQFSTKDSVLKLSIYYQLWTYSFLVLLWPFGCSASDRLLILESFMHSCVNLCVPLSQGCCPKLDDMLQLLLIKDFNQLKKLVLDTYTVTLFLDHDCDMIHSNKKIKYGKESTRKNSSKTWILPLLSNLPLFCHKFQ